MESAVVVQEAPYILGQVLWSQNIIPSSENLKTKLSGRDVFLCSVLLTSDTPHFCRSRRLKRDKLQRARSLQRACCLTVVADQNTRRTVARHRIRRQVDVFHGPSSSSGGNASQSW